MTQADRVHSTPPINTPTTQQRFAVEIDRRRFLSNAAGIAAAGTVLALATIPPASAAAAPATALDPANASPALRAAAIAMDEAHERLKAAKARFDADDAKLLAWEDNNPEPTGSRINKHEYGALPSPYKPKMSA